MSNPRIAFIGAGNMASSLIGGLIESGLSTDSIVASDPLDQNLRRLSDEYDIETFEQNATAVEHADIVILAVKPQTMKTVGSDLKGKLNADSLLISIAAGITTESLAEWFGHQRIVRCMPNTPALIKQGVTGLYATESVTQSQRDAATRVFDSVGMSFWLDREELIDAVTAVSGSGPAYFFRFMECMAESARQLGIDADLAQEIVIQTCLGAAELAKSSPDSLSELRKKVTSPNGTTEKALQRFEHERLAETVEQAMADAADRARELASELGKSKQ